MLLGVGKANFRWPFLDVARWLLVTGAAQS